jgi:hypothetical protein
MQACPVMHRFCQVIIARSLEHLAREHELNQILAFFFKAISSSTDHIFETQQKKKKKNEHSTLTWFLEPPTLITILGTASEIDSKSPLQLPHHRKQFNSP